MDPYIHKLNNIISTHFTITDTSEQGLREAAQLVRDVADSFDGCTICWGRGWLGDLAVNNEYCDCKRGELLAKFVAQKNAIAR